MKYLVFYNNRTNILRGILRLQNYNFYAVQHINLQKTHSDLVIFKLKTTIILQNGDSKKE